MRARRLLLSALITACSLPVLQAATTQPCMEHECSNDFTRNRSQEAIYGDELLVWEPNPAWAWRECDPSPAVPCVRKANLRCYELALYPELSIVARRCESATWVEEIEGWVYLPPPTAATPYGTEPNLFPHYGAVYDYIVRACEGDSCGEWSQNTETSATISVEFIGGEYACFGSDSGKRCEAACYPGAPKRFPPIPDCPQS
jgi:hypothetical protein